jgi:ABC-2 type transport system permease protein
MRSVGVLAGREFRSYFAAPAAYVVLMVFLAVTGYLFTLSLFMTREASMQYVFRSMGMVLVFLIPALTMRLLSEEQRSGTLDLLLSYPLHTWELILGKYLGSLAFYALMLLLTMYYPLILALVGRPDYVPIVVGYLGVFILGAAILAVGLWTSSLTRSQIVAYVASFGILLPVWILDKVGGYAGAELVDFFNWLAMSWHFDDFTRGILDSRHVVYYLTWVLLFLALSTLSLNIRRWL